MRQLHLGAGNELLENVSSDVRLVRNLFRPLPDGH